MKNLNEQGLFEIMEKIHDWHNAKMSGLNYSPEMLKNLRLKIIELAGLDYSELLCRCDDIDGCCVAILQEEKPNWKAEADGIDRYSSDIRNMIETIGE